MRWIFVVLFLWSQFKVQAQDKVFEFDATCQQAYQEVMKLKLNAAQQFINQAKAEKPNNLIPHFIENYIDFFLLFFNEDPDEFANRKPNKDTRLDLMDEGSDEDPWKMYCKGVIRMQWAAVRIKFGETVSAGFQFKSGFGDIKDNKKKFPKFSPNDLLQGSLEAAVGTIPGGVKWLANLFGVKGTIKGGMRKLEGFINSEDSLARILRAEAIFYYCYLKFYIENKPDEAIAMIKGKKADEVNSHLFAYQLANLNINNKNCEAGKQAILKRNLSPDYMTTGIWDFELGHAKLYHLEPDANIYLERFIANFKGNFYVKEVLMKLSWHYYLQGNIKKAYYYKDQCYKRGQTNSDADKKAMKDAQKEGFPNAVLLKARLLNDGGYHQEALRLLLGKSTTDFAKEEEKLEFNYRLARIYDDLGRFDDAKQAYLATIKRGEKSTEYFAARACVQLAMMLEKRGERALAINFYQMCLDLGDHDYKNSLDQKAKAGIARCKGE
jgi:hypothetical protein